MTKGPSNRFGSTRGSRNGWHSSRISYPWAKAFNKTTLPVHFERHAKDFNTPNEREYEAKAITFANTVDRKNCISFIDKNDSTYKFNKVTGELAIITKRGIVVTYFKPVDGIKYYFKEKENRKK